jgi:uncharacterized protein YcaQ
MRTNLSAAEARRVALAAQGFADAPPRGRVDARHLRRVLSRIGLVQIDSVNVVVRSHYLPFFSRLGPYPRAALDRLAYRRRELFEYWAHEASLVPTEREPLFRHRMAAWATRRARRIEWLHEHRHYLDAVLAEVRERGPLQASDLDDPGERRGPWWGYGKGKIALESHFGMGTVAIAGRRNFARLYDLRERVLPARVRERPAPDAAEAARELLLLAARHHGVGTARDLADYYRLPVNESKRHLEDLADEGALQRAQVEDWREVAYLHPQARLPRRVEARALLSPFDSLVWERERTSRLFDFDYRIEIYTPAPRRRYGYYVLPFLLGDRLVGRVDVKADRERAALVARAAHLEPAEDAAAVAPHLAEELRSMADWLELERVEADRRGDLAPALSSALTARQSR